MLLSKYKDAAMPKAEYAEFILDEEKCNGCGRCVKTCPIQLLVLVDKKARNNERYDSFRCITCQNCAASCPNDAITINGDYRVADGYWKNSDIYDETKSWPNPFPEKSDMKFEDYENELTETERIIFKRRSIRLYKKKQVPKELVNRVIEAGRYAPSAGNNQPWKFIVIQDRGVIEEINQRCKKFLKLVMMASMPMEWIEKKVPGNKNAKLKWWQKLIVQSLVRFRKYPGEIDPRARGGMNTVVSDPDYDVFFGAPTLIIILADKRGIGSYELDTGICGQNMVLAAHAMGLGTCYIGLIDGLQFYKKFQKQLGIEEPFEIVTSFTLGYPKGQIDNVVKREKARVNWIG